MKVIIRPRRTGRTDELIALCHKEGGYIAVGSHREAWQVAERARSLGQPVPFPVSYDDILHGRLHGGGVTKVWIDNADSLLSYMVSHAGSRLTGFVIEAPEP